MTASVAVCAPRPGLAVHSVQTVVVEGTPVTLGLVEATEPRFSSADPGSRNMVLLRVRAFSCNYRDRALILHLARRCAHDDGPESVAHIGSEFVADVLATGEDVTRCQPGDRVIADVSYPYSGTHGVAPGVATNHASQRFRLLHEAKVRVVPPTMPDAAAAAFGLGAQTAYAILRRLQPAPDSTVLVTAARSATALFTATALRNRTSARVVGLTSSTGHERALRAHGFHDVVTLPRGRDRDGTRFLLDTLGPVDVVIDPFFDLYLDRTLPMLRPGGQYLTCGLENQSAIVPGDGDVRLTEVLLLAIARNLQLIGNCLGSPEDLTDALEDHAAGRVPVVIDSVHRAETVGDFLLRTYSSQNRFGKAVFVYESPGVVGDRTWPQT